MSEPKDDEVRPAADEGGAATAPGEADAAALQADVARLEDEVRRLHAQVESHLDLARRSQAELANAQQRMRRDLDNARKYALEGFVRDLLPAVDNLDRSIEAVSKREDAQALVEALRLIERELLRALSKGGIRPIDSDGTRFDPSLHEAITLVESETQDDQTVAATLRRGWLIEDRVLRPAHVAVVKKKADPGGKADEGEAREEGASGAGEGGATPA